MELAEGGDGGHRHRAFGTPVDQQLVTSEGESESLLTFAVLGNHRGYEIIKH